jgi:hypothetical protein
MNRTGNAAAVFVALAFGCGWAAPIGKLEIQTSSNYSPIQPDSCDTLFIPSTAISSSIYAIWIDQFYNFIAYSKVTEWRSRDTAVVGIRPGNTSIGEGIVYRKADSGTTMIYGTDSCGATDSCVVVLQCQCSYTSLSIYTLNPYHPGADTIRIPLNDSLILYAEARRPDDTTRWEAVAVSWSKSANLKTKTAPPGAPTDHWTVAPDSEGEGWVTVRMGVSAAPDSVWVIFYDPISIRENPDMPLRPDVWSIHPENGGVRVHFPAKGLYSVKIYSLTGQMVVSRDINEVGRGDAVFQLPRGVFIVNANALVGGSRNTKKVVIASEQR